MILKALKELAEREGLIPLPHYQRLGVHWLIRVSPNGGFLGISQTLGPEIGTGKRLPKSYFVPWRATRTSGDRAQFLVDKAEYVFGLGTKSAAKLRARQELFLEKVERAADETGDEGTSAVRNFLVSLIEGKTNVNLPEEMTPDDICGFIYDPDETLLVSSRPVVVRYWSSVRGSEPEDTVSELKDVTCLACGNTRIPLLIHHQVKKVPGPPGEKSIVSFNKDAFKSYGLEQSENGPVCLACVDAYTTALNRLLDPGYPSPSTGEPMARRNVRLSDNTVAVFWAGSDTECVDVFEAVLGRNEPEEVKVLYGSPWKGRQIRLDDPTMFYALTLSGAKGRATFRSYFQSTVADVVENLKRHFEDLEIVDLYSQEPTPLPLWLLLRSISVQRKAENIPPHLATEAFHSALTGRAYPWVLLEAAVRRLRAEGTTPRERMALIKAVLNRRRRFDPMAAARYKEVTKEMDATNTNTGYRLGRLLAVLEHLQGRAIGNPGATIVDRYFGSASTTPRRVFPSLLKLAQAHAGKLGGALFHQKLIGEILEPIGPSEGFPATLSLENQGLFALGYYHQRAELWKKREASVES